MITNEDGTILTRVTVARVGWVVDSQSPAGSPYYVDKEALGDENSLRSLHGCDLWINHERSVGHLVGLPHWTGEALYCDALITDTEVAGKVSEMDSLGETIEVSPSYTCEFYKSNDRLLQRNRKYTEVSILLGQLAAGGPDLVLESVNSTTVPSNYGTLDLVGDVVVIEESTMDQDFYEKLCSKMDEMTSRFESICGSMEGYMGRFESMMAPTETVESTESTETDDNSVAEAAMLDLGLQLGKFSNKFSVEVPKEGTVTEILGAVLESAGFKPSRNSEEFLRSYLEVALETQPVGEVKESVVKKSAVVDHTHPEGKPEVSKVAESHKRYTDRLFNRTK